MKFITAFIAFLLMTSFIFSTEAIVAKTMFNFAKPFAKKLKNISNKVVDKVADNVASSATLFVLEETSKNWKNKISKTISVTPKPKPTQPPKTFVEKIKNEKKSNSQPNKQINK